MPVRYRRLTTPKAQTTQRSGRGENEKEYVL
jgi:hypothetical protein